ncbi:hypothetical protein EX30DRAFT_398842 [Ascodesmis nigricans]|uniref:RNA-binding domain-containing protein n=1 Tax=Ascodesmis nigricans TaxID=341454 RepID=A0A4S2MJN6_9PEZI|nr:hypothetical protein EX30DRAFT_398842 [Ascodesmis nigricans]
MLFDDGDTELLKQWIVKRLEDISDADSDVLADYVLALLKHDQADQEVERLCVEQLDDFLREHTRQFVTDLFVGLRSRAYLPSHSKSATITSANQPQEHSIKLEDSPSGARRDQSLSPYTARAERRYSDSRDNDRGRKRSYYDRDAGGFNDDPANLNGSSRGGRDGGRGAKMPRRGASSGRWARGGYEGDTNSRTQSSPTNASVSPTVPMVPPAPFPLQPAPVMPWFPPNPDDPMAAFMAAQVAAAAAAGWGSFPGGPNVPGSAGVKRPAKKIGQRCKDYDEKGFCMKGDMCPYEHGTNPIVVPGQKKEDDAEYDPNNSALLPVSSTSSNPLSSSAPLSSRPSRGGRGRGSNRSRGGHGFHHLGGRTGRSELSATGPNWDKANARLVVENIPEEHLSEPEIREYFTQFGSITACDVQPHRNLAVLTFQTWDEAKAAYDSPAAIFNNRFVKVFWYKNSDEDASGGDKHSSANGGMEIDSETHAEPEINIEEIKARQEELQRAHEEKMAKKKALEEQAAEIKRKQEEAAKERQKLLDIIAKKEAKKSKSATPAPDATANGAAAKEPTPVGEDSEKAKLTAALKAQLSALEAEASALGIDPATANEEDTFDLAGFRGAYQGRGRGGYRGRFPTTYRGAYRGGYSTFAPRGRGRGRGTLRPTMGLDNRPRKVAVTLKEGAFVDDSMGTEEQEEEFRCHLINSGIELESRHQHPDKKNTIILVFPDRHNAEMFVKAGSHLPGFGHVVMAWHSDPPGSNPNISTSKLDHDNDTKMLEVGDDHHQMGVRDEELDMAEDDAGRWEDL